MADRFVNPYNFTALPGKMRVGRTDRGSGTHTGCITFQITTKTSLFIPNTGSIRAFRSFTDKKIREAYRGKPEEDMKKALEKHRSYDFYSYRQMDPAHDYTHDAPALPVIPGSGIRGMVRSIYETLTDSCFRVLNENTYVPKRTAEIFKLGLIRKSTENGKVVYTLCRPLDVCFVFLNRNGVGEAKEGSLVFFDSYQDGRILRADAVRTSGSGDMGYILKGMRDKVGKKKSAHIAMVNKSTGKNPLAVLREEDLERLRQVIVSYQDEPGAEKAYEEYEEGLKRFLSGRSKQEYFPVYYSQMDSCWYLSPASITKEISYHTIGDAAGDMRPCRKRKDACPACLLFGMTGDGVGESMGSSVRFTDAVIQKPEEDARSYYDPISVMQVLASPKVSNSEFYLQGHEGAVFWTYDYYVSGGKAHPYEARIRGRKHYWHHPDFKLARNVQPSDLNKTIRSVKKDVTFTAQVFFDGISDLQLDRLLWILNGGNAEDAGSGEICYKLGGGKPLGFGSVKLKVISLRKRRLESAKEGISYKTTDQQNPAIPGSKACGFSAAFGPFKTICSFESAKDRIITYPVTAEQIGKPMEEGFRWFQMNHSDRNGKNGFRQRRTDMNIHRRLPLLSDRVTDLPVRPVSGGAAQPVKKKEKEAPAGAGKKRSSVLHGIWIAEPPISEAQIKRIQDEIPGLKIDSEKGWASAQNLKRLSGAYMVVLLPSKTKDDILALAMELFAHVYKSVRNGKIDEGWEKLK